MQLVLSAISAGGLVGAADQYLCLLLLAAAARLDYLKLAPEMHFMESDWFIGLVGFFWVVTVAPGYLALVAPGAMNAVNTFINFFSGFVVPLSSAMVSLASVGAITYLDPELQGMIQTVQIFNPEGGIGPTGLLIAGASALTATSLTGMKALAKPSLSLATGTAGTVSAPAYATSENLASVLLMGLAYILVNIDPWLLVALLALVVLLTLIILAFAIYQLWKLKKGIGRVLHLIQTRPKAGWAAVAEFFVWGAGWLMWGIQGRGGLMVGLWLLWLAGFFLIVPGAMAALSAILVVFPPLLLIPPLLGVCIQMMLVMVFAWTGSRSAGALLRQLERGEIAGGQSGKRQALPG